MNTQFDLWPETDDDLRYREDDWIVLSLQPEAWNAIRSKIKKFEYRRRFRARQTLAYIYVSSPVSAVCGLVLFGTPISGSASEIAVIAEQQRPGNGKSVHAYLEKGDHGYAIPVKEVYEFGPVSLGYLRDQCSFVAPQLYLSLNNNRPLWQVLKAATAKEITESVEAHCV